MEDAKGAWSFVSTPRKGWMPGRGLLSTWGCVCVGMGMLYPGVCLTVGGLTTTKPPKDHWPNAWAAMTEISPLCWSLASVPTWKVAWWGRNSSALGISFIKLEPDQLPFPAHGLSSGSLSVLLSNGAGHLLRKALVRRKWDGDAGTGPKIQGLHVCLEVF